ncbi:MAG TPA: hypothetical protein VK447_20005, partial [Myxococcaceae bacterium]|nr:hypothetical protein [Myxococcaceae bacterium]
VGVYKEGHENTLYVDFLGVDMATVGPGKTARGACISTKSHAFDAMTVEEARAIARADFAELQTKYGGILEVRRPGHPLFRQKVEVTRLRLVYDAEMVKIDKMRAAILRALEGKVEVHFQ